MTSVTVTRVDERDGSSVWTGRGVDDDTGDVISFAGDWRPMRDIARAVADGLAPVVELESWQILRRAPFATFNNAT